MMTKIQTILLIFLMAVFTTGCSKNQSNKAPEAPVVFDKNNHSPQEILNNQIGDRNEAVVEMNPVIAPESDTASKTTETPEAVSEPETFDSRQTLSSPIKEDLPLSDQNTQFSENQEDDEEVFEIQQVVDVKKEVKVQNLSRQNQDFLPYTTTQVVFPEDYLIGSLYNPAESSLENQSIAKTAQDFLNQLKQAILNDKVIGSGSVVKIRSLVTNIIEKQIPLTSYRIGVITTEEQKSRVNIRLWSTLSTVDGELYLTKIDNKWYIEDLQANIVELATKSEKKEEAYMPSSYDFQ